MHSSRAYVLHLYLLCNPISQTPALRDELLTRLNRFEQDSKSWCPYWPISQGVSHTLPCISSNLRNPPTRWRSVIVNEPSFPTWSVFPWIGEFCTDVAIAKAPWPVLSERPGPRRILQNGSSSHRYPMTLPSGPVAGFRRAPSSALCRVEQKQKRWFVPFRPSVVEVIIDGRPPRLQVGAADNHDR
ncbi:hypothetical protein C8R46DRAFT_358375 [Mycena filopes]|nr:hypothetical protein C8R46DRAFT_358375 [Mycena filopes]